MKWLARFGVKIQIGEIPTSGYGHWKSLAGFEKLVRCNVSIKHFHILKLIFSIVKACACWPSSSWITKRYTLTWSHFCFMWWQRPTRLDVTWSATFPRRRIPFTITTFLAFWLCHLISVKDLADYSLTFPIFFHAPKTKLAVPKSRSLISASSPTGHTGKMSCWSTYALIQIKKYR